MKEPMEAEDPVKQSRQIIWCVVLERRASD